MFDPMVGNLTARPTYFHNTKDRIAAPDISTVSPLIYFALEICQKSDWQSGSISHKVQTFVYLLVSANSTLSR